MIGIRTVSDRQIDLECPRSRDIEIGDIARGLSHCCRFAGQLPGFYSVAQHSVLVASLCDEPLRLAGLLHDATEAYMGDLSRNLKHSEFLAGYRVLEQRLARAIQIRFGYLTSLGDLEQIKLADNLAACFERVILRERQERITMEDVRRLLREGYVWSTAADLERLYPRLPTSFATWNSPLAENRFLERFEAYRQISSTAYELNFRGTNPACGG